MVGARDLVEVKLVLSLSSTKHKIADRRSDGNRLERHIQFELLLGFSRDHNLKSRIVSTGRSLERAA